MSGPEVKFAQLRHQVEKIKSHSWIFALIWPFWNKICLKQYWGTLSCLFRGPLQLSDHSRVVVHLNFNRKFWFGLLKFYPLLSKASREVTNLTERKNPHTPIYRRFSIRYLVVVGLINRQEKSDGCEWRLFQCFDEHYWRDNISNKFFHFYIRCF